MCIKNLTYTKKLIVYSKSKIGISNNNNSFNSFISKIAKITGKQSIAFGIWHTQFVEANKSILNKHASKREINIYTNYKSQKRQTEFLGARILTKMLINDLIKKTKSTNYEAELKEISILKYKNGSPKILIKDKECLSLKVSISHRGDYIFACVSKKNIGVDVERLSLQLARLKPRFLSNEEERLLEALWQSNSFDTSYAFVWSSKEAIAKYLKKSVLHIIRNATLIKVSDNILTFSYKNAILSTYNFNYDDYVFSIVFSKT